MARASQVPRLMSPAPWVLHCGGRTRGKRWTLASSKVERGGTVSRCGIPGYISHALDAVEVLVHNGRLAMKLKTATLKDDLPQPRKPRPLPRFSNSLIGPDPSRWVTTARDGMDLLAAQVPDRTDKNPSYLELRNERRSKTRSTTGVVRGLRHRVLSLVQ